MTNPNTQAAGVSTAIAIATQAAFSSAAATSALGAAAGPIGALVGALAAAVIVPAIAPEPDIDGDQFDGIPVGGSNEGAPKTFCIGPVARCRGNVIWATPIRIIEQSIGKGGLFGSSIQRQVRDIAYCFAWNEVEGIPRIQANGVTIYDENSLLNLDPPSTQIRAVQVQVLGGGVLQASLQVYISEATGADLTRFRSGIPIEITGFANAQFNGTFNDVRNSLTGPIATNAFTMAAGETAIVVALPNGTPLGVTDEAAGNPIQMTQTLNDLDISFAQSVEIRTGRDPGVDPAMAAPSSIMSAALGTDIPHYFDRAIAVFSQVDCTNTGGRAPTLVAQVDEVAAPNPGDFTIRDLISTILTRVARLDPSEFDVSQVPAFDATGISYIATRGADELLTPIVVGLRIDAQDNGEQLVFFQRQDAVTHVITEDELETHGIDDDPPGGPILWAEREDALFPSLLELEYIDADSENQRGLVPIRAENVTRENVLRVRVPVRWQNAQAKCQGQAIMFDLGAQKYEIEISVPSARFEILEGDLIEITRFGVVQEFRVISVDRGQNQVFRLKCKSVDLQTEVQDANDCFAQPPPGGSSVIFIPSEIDVVPLDIPALLSSTLEVPTMLFQGSRTDQRGIFRGITYYEQLEPATGFGARAFLEAESAVGLMAVGLDDHPPGHFDFENTITVLMLNGEPGTTITRDDLAALQTNIAAIGRPETGFEIVAYQTIVSTGTDEYQISGFVRGLRGTEFRQPTHGPGEFFVPLRNDGTLGVLERIPSQVGLEVQSKGVASNGFEPSADVDFVWDIRNESIATFGPDVMISRDPATDEFMFRFRRNDRSLNGAFNEVDHPNTDSDLLSIQYEVDILGAMGNVLRTLQAGGTNVGTIEVMPFDFYPLATVNPPIYGPGEQITDFGSVQATITVHAYEVGPNGRGNPTRQTYVP